MNMVEGSRTASYSPSVLPYSWGTYDPEYNFHRSQIQLMDRDPRLRIGFRIICAPVEAATWEVICDNPACQEFIDNTIRHFWMHDLTKCLEYMKYGSLGGELVYRYDEEAQRWEYDSLKDFHLDDVVPLDLKGNLWGVRVKGLEPGDGHHEGNGTGNKNGHLNLQYPSSFWIANEPKCSSYYGWPRYEGAFKPWKEKTGKHGAIDIRKNWMVKNSMRGAQLRYPEGTTLIDGHYTSNQDVAREILEKYMAGHVIALPSARDDKGNYLWEWVEPRAGETVSNILEYSPMLDKEILEGLEIWPEVLQAPDVGAGWSGRAIPFMMFLSSEDRIIMTVLSQFVRQCVRPLVRINFGPKQRFRVDPVSLLPKSQAADTASATGGPPGAAGLVQQPEMAAQPEATAGLLTTPEVIPEGTQLSMIDQDGIVTTVNKSIIAAKSISSDVTTAVQAAVIRLRQRLLEARKTA